tara:strand:+ start:275 stop:535 length:261 start_codon:yes stop_codon:yes gene_type:complete
MKVAKYFSATWCGPCKAFKPIMEELKEEGYDITFLDVDENSGLAKQYNIRSVPTTIIEERVVPSHVNITDTIIGARTKEEIIQLLS